jgi:hypothetical protein
LLLAVLVGCVASLVVGSDARGDQRQQIKWVAWPSRCSIFSFALSSIFLELGIETDLVATRSSRASRSCRSRSRSASRAFSYRLYDLDVVVKKALVAGALAVFVVAVYGAWSCGRSARSRRDVRVRRPCS